MNVNEQYHLFSEPLSYYNEMIEDIEKAKDYICIETFRIGKDEIGDRFRRALTRKANEGVKVKLLIDYWGSGPVDNEYFSDLIKGGGQVRFFEKIKFNSDIFTRGHRRNHRKLLLIDDKVSYIGSSNLTGYNMNWRESVLRMQSSITCTFAKLFEEDFESYNKYIFNNPSNSKQVNHDSFEIIRDVPSITRKQINNKFIGLIKEAKSMINIETPYFLPGFFLRKALMDAAQRGVEVNVILPRHSDVTLIDILRNKYFGILYKSGVNILFYEMNNLHAKLMLVDKKIFAIGSSNFDYRSFRYMYEIMLIGDNESIARQISAHVNTTILDSKPFRYQNWKERPLINKIFEWMLLPFRHLL
ncbi:MAG: phosphatidylserine/phosphatidylglycerophosphate/cardiolipin synthase family protein [Bacteroidales bacterium]|nr:phosphatidylserine/phosphatidylglycerophosphate/cardiolipin synthase family protein [Bacteroidales bacterium]MDG2081358.1 phosphatidylserine/phosphatidylglycerophosphate/cardiolipin synthase family protein [Bacteroidales bacterium]